MIGWLPGAATWETADYPELIIQTYQEAIDPAQPLHVHEPWVRSSVLTKHQVVRVMFGWGPDLRSETWTGMFGVGPLGCARLAQNPAALAAALAYERFDLDSQDVLGAFGTHQVCELLADVIGPPSGPDFMGRTDREHHARAGILEERDIKAVSDRCVTRILTPDDPTAWRAVVQGFVPMTCIARPYGLVARFTRMAGIGFRRVEITNYEIEIARATYAITWRTKVLARMACKVHAMAIPGRPLLVGATPQRAPLVRRADWCK